MAWNFDDVDWILLLVETSECSVEAILLHPDFTGVLTALRWLMPQLSEGETLNV